VSADIDPEVVALFSALNGKIDRLSEQVDEALRQLARIETAIDQIQQDRRQSRLGDPAHY
jgi:chromosome segregation ATPase